MTKTAVSPMIVAGARLRMAKPPSRRSDIVIGASAGSARLGGRGARRRTATAAPAGGRGASAAASGAAQSTAPFYRPGSRGGARTAFRPATLLAWRATTRRPTATASPTSTTTGTATSPTSRRAPTRLAALAGGGPVLELGVGSGRLALPLAARGVEVHGIDASEAMLARLRAKPGGDAIHLTHGDMADLGARRPAGVHGGVRRLQHAVQPRHGRGAAAVPASASPALLAPDGAVRGRGVRARRRRRRRARRRRSRRAASPPTRWCCR